MYRKLLLIFFILQIRYISSQDNQININTVSKEDTINIVQDNYKYKIKDIVRITGYKNNQLIGYGLVVGLNNTGDTKWESNKQILNKILQKLNVQYDLKGFQPKNVASVIVTAEIPPFAKKGDRLTCYVSSIGDAKSIQEGILIQTPLYGANGQIYAVAQGKLVQENDNNKFFKSNTGYIVNGAIIERDLQELEFQNQIRLQLLEFDFERLNVIYQKLKSDFSELEISIEGGNIVILFKDKEKINDTLVRILNTEVELPLKNKIIIYQKDKTILVTGNIAIKPFLMGKVDKDTRYSKIQREAYQGIYIYTPSELKNPSILYFRSTNIKDFIHELNSYHLGIEEIIQIFRGLVETGQLNAELIIR